MLGRVLNLFHMKYKTFRSAMELCYDLNMLPVTYGRNIDEFHSEGKNFLNIDILVKRKPKIEKTVTIESKTVME